MAGSESGYRSSMDHAADNLILLLATGLEGWMLGASTDASEIFAFVEMTDNTTLPRSPEAIDALFTTLHEAGLVVPRPRLSRAEAQLATYRAYALTPAGWARVRTLEGGAGPHLRVL